MHAWWSTESRLTILLLSLIAPRTSDSMTVPTKELSVHERVGA